VDDWPIAELVGYVETCLAEVPHASKNGQVRAVPDERTVRYYGTIGLLDKPNAMRGRTALYGRKHVAQILAIKRLQSDGRSLAEIQAVWPQLDDVTLSRMSGVQFPPRAKSRKEFWKDEPKATNDATAPEATPSQPTQPVELRIELAPGVMLTVAVPDAGIAIAKADIDAIRAAAASVVTELAQRQLTMNAREEKT
jgi:DNA-binding transcriptional MerR regulator